jgi:TPR repeat protein
MAYEIGLPVRQNCTEAARWIAIAAQEGSAAAQYNLALRYRQGDGTAVNLEESKKWMGKAASRGYEKAQSAMEAMASTNPASAGGQ